MKGSGSSSRWGALGAEAPGEGGGRGRDQGRRLEHLPWHREKAVGGAGVGKGWLAGTQGVRSGQAWSLASLARDARLEGIHQIICGAAPCPPVQDSCPD